MFQNSCWAYSVLFRLSEFSEPFFVVSEFLLGSFWPSQTYWTSFESFLLMFWNSCLPYLGLCKPFMLTARSCCFSPFSVFQDSCGAYSGLFRIILCCLFWLPWLPIQLGYPEMGNRVCCICRHSRAIAPSCPAHVPESEARRDLHGLWAGEHPQKRISVLPQHWYFDWWPTLPTLERVGQAWRCTRPKSRGLRRDRTSCHN